MTMTAAIPPTSTGRPTMIIDDFVLRALVAAAGIALLCGPLGAVLVWRRMAYFGDALSHSALLGIALGLAIGTAPHVMIVIVCAAIALCLSFLEGQRSLAIDTFLGIMAHGALAGGLVALSFVQGARLDLMAYLFGDILAVTWVETAWIYAGVAMGLVILTAVWRRLLAVTVHEDLARAEGISVGLVRAAYMLLIAIVIAVAMRVVGVLLVTALLIIPAAAARRRARSPEGMALRAAALGLIAGVAGIAASYIWDSPAGPSIVVAAVALFLASFALPRRI